MKETLKGWSAWCFFNGLFMWATVSACILGSAIGYNFMAWITCILCVFMILGFISTQVLCVHLPDKYQEIKDTYNSSWHVPRKVDIFYDFCILLMMVYGGFLGIASIYFVTMFVQNLYIIDLKRGTTQELSSEDIVNQYDDDLLDRMGIDQNERGR